VRTYDLLRKSAKRCGTTRPAARAPPLHLSPSRTAILRGWRDSPSRRVHAFVSVPCSRLRAGRMRAVCRVSSPTQTAIPTTLNDVKHEKRTRRRPLGVPFPVLFTAGVCSVWRLASRDDLPLEHEADLAFGGPRGGRGGGVSHTRGRRSCADSGTGRPGGRALFRARQSNGGTKTGSRVFGEGSLGRGHFPPQLQASVSLDWTLGCGRRSVPKWDAPDR